MNTNDLRILILLGFKKIQKPFIYYFILYLTDKVTEIKLQNKKYYNFVRKTTITVVKNLVLKNILCKNHQFL